MATDDDLLHIVSLDRRKGCQNAHQTRLLVLIVFLVQVLKNGTVDQRCSFDSDKHFHS